MMYDIALTQMLCCGPYVQSHDPVGACVMERNLDNMEVSQVMLVMGGVNRGLCRLLLLGLYVWAEFSNPSRL